MAAKSNDQKGRVTPASTQSTQLRGAGALTTGLPHPPAMPCSFAADPLGLTRGVYGPVNLAGPFTSVSSANEMTGAIPTWDPSRATAEAAGLKSDA